MASPVNTTASTSITPPSTGVGAVTRKMTLSMKSQPRIRVKPVFHKFPKLPLELRDRIWELSAPPPQLVNLYYVKPKKPGGFRIDRINSCAASYRMPALMDTNTESRSVGMRIYTKVFADRLGGIGVWMDLSLDILFFSDPLACIGFFGGRHIHESRQEKIGGYIKPLDQPIHALAFDAEQCYPALFSLRDAFVDMGKPPKIYQILSPIAFTSSLFSTGGLSYGSNRDPGGRLGLTGIINDKWEVYAKWFKALKFEKPVVKNTTIPLLRDQLKNTNPPLPKRAREPTSENIPEEVSNA